MLESWRKQERTSFSHHGMRNNSIPLNELTELGNGHHQTLVMDLEDTEGIAGCVQPVLDKGPIHILINNAGGLREVLC